MNKRFMFCALLFLCAQHQLRSKELPIPEPQEQILDDAAKNLNVALFDEKLSELEESGNVYNCYRIYSWALGYLSKYYRDAAHMEGDRSFYEFSGAVLTAAFGVYAASDYSEGCKRVDAEWTPGSWNNEECDRHASWRNLRITDCVYTYNKLTLEQKRELLTEQKDNVSRFTFSGEIASFCAVLTGITTAVFVVDHIMAWRRHSRAYSILKRLADSPCCDEETKGRCKEVLEYDDKH